MNTRSTKTTVANTSRNISAEPTINSQCCCNRNKKWTTIEETQLLREFDLYDLGVAEIASLHQRSPHAILYKIEALNDVADPYYDIRRS